MFLWETHIMFLLLVCESLYGGETFKNVHKRATSTPPILNANIWGVYMLTFSSQLHSLKNFVLYLCISYLIHGSDKVSNNSML